jgi:DNA-binding CsgD family transcriptional regulator
MGATASFGLWVEALEQHLRPRSEKDIRSVCGGYLDDLAVLLRTVAAVRGSVPDGEPPRARLLEGLAVVVRNLTAASPVVLFLDDVHLADASSWECLAYMARTLPDAPLFVLASARPVELGEQRLAVDVLLALEQDGLMERLPIEPLEVDDLRQLADGVVPDRSVPESLVAWLYERSRGNPLFAIGLLHALLEEGADLDRPELRSLPESLAERVMSRLTRFDEPSLATLEMLAMLGHPVELRDLVSLAGRPYDRLAVILERLVRGRLVTEEARDHELVYQIAHPLIQETIYRGIGGARRSALHRLVGRALLEAGRLGEATPHFALSAEPGDDEAIRALQAAMRQAEGRESHLEAMAILEALAGVIPSGDPRWVGVLDAMSVQPSWVVDHRGGVHAVAGIRALREIETLLERSGEPSSLAAVKFRLGVWAGWSTGDVAEAARKVGEARDLFSAAGETERALLARHEFAFLRGMRGDVAGWASEEREVAAAARAGGMPFVEIQALGGLGIASYFAGVIQEAEQALTRSLALAVEHGAIYRVSWNRAHLAEVVAFDGRVDEARELIQVAMDEDADYRSGILPSWAVGVRWLAGDLAEAMRIADEIVEGNRRGLDSRHLFAMSYAAAAAVEAGALSQARRYVEAFRRVPIGESWFGVEALPAWAEGVLEVREGSRGGLDVMAGAARRLTDRGCVPYAAFAWVDVAELAGRHGAAGLASETSSVLDELCALHPHPMVAALAGLARGYAAVDGLSPPPPPAELRRAASAFATAGWRLFEGRALAVLGRLLVLDAVAQLTEAARAFETCGATARHDDVLHALAGLGTRGRRAAAAVAGPESLTRRERDVVLLAVEGLTAKEIGERLFIGERTVETHLANAYAKLGVSSKLELVRRASELGVTAD